MALNGLCCLLGCIDRSLFTTWEVSCKWKCTRDNAVFFLSAWRGAAKEGSTVRTSQTPVAPCSSTFTPWTGILNSAGQQHCLQLWVDGDGHARSLNHSLFSFQIRLGNTDCTVYPFNSNFLVSSVMSRSCYFLDTVGVVSCLVHCKPASLWLLLCCF